MRSETFLVVRKILTGFYTFWEYYKFFLHGGRRANAVNFRIMWRNFLPPVMDWSMLDGCQIYLGI